MSEAQADEPRAKRSKLQMPLPVIGILVLALGAFYITSRTTAKKVPAAPPAIEHRGIAQVVDGDTADLKEIRHRLFGIDAPDEGGSAGEYHEQSKIALATAAQFEWICEDTGTRSRDRYVSICTFAMNGEDVGEWMVRAGYAVDWSDFSGGRYAEAERLAKADRVGIWQTYDKSWR